MANLESSEPPVGSAEFDSALKAREEAKRERMADPQRRWKVLQQAITWADQQRTVRRNSREECLRRQAILLASMAKYEGRATGQ